MILEASMKLFVEEGFEKVTIRKIADIIEYSPTTIYLHFKDKDEILFNLHEIGFQKMAEYNQFLGDIKNPLLRLHKLGENYLRFGMDHPEFYDLMFVQKAPMKVINQTIDCEWKAGDSAMQVLKDILAECVEKKMIMEADVNVMAMAIWSMVHGLVSLANTNRMNKFMTEEEVLPMMTKGLNWLMNTMDLSVK